jgi:putative nucleotidyltransferase with HDIG domain
MRTENSDLFVKELDTEVRTLNAIVTFAVYCMLLLLIKTLYDSLILMPNSAIAAIIIIVASLLVASVYLLKKISNKAIRNIAAYAAKLDGLLRCSGDIREDVYTDALLNKVLAHAVAMTCAEGGAITLIEGDTLTCKTTLGEGLIQHGGESYALMEGIEEWVARSSELLRTNAGNEGFAAAPWVLRSKGEAISSIICTPLRVRSKLIGIIQLFTKGEKRFDSDDEAIIDYFANQAAFSLEKVKFQEDQKNYEVHITEILQQSMDSHLPIKRAHSENVARYSHLIAKSVELPFERMNILHHACILHDIGFIKFPLTAECDKDVQMKHCTAGYNMLKSISFFTEVAPIILHHHERFDGTGYPEKLKGTEIPVESRIISIAEAFDAMTSKNSYKKPLSLTDALQELTKNAGTQFDPDLVTIFFKAFFRERAYASFSDGEYLSLVPSNPMAENGFLEQPAKAAY